jgi:hypothetical protein
MKLVEGHGKPEYVQILCSIISFNNGAELRNVSGSTNDRITPIVPAISLSLAVATRHNFKKK